MFLEPLKFDAARDLLDRRVKGASLKREAPPEITDMFEKKALEVLYDNSVGNPGLLLRCASKALEVLRNHTIDGSQAKTLGKFKVNEETALQAASIVGCLQAKDGLQALSKFKAIIFEQILSTWMTPTQISSTLTKDRTTISRHLSDLKGMGIVEQSLRGRESYYRVTEPARVQYEVGKMPEAHRVGKV
jgi:DNA-binding transcriptional ArsR family regulator